MIELSGMTATVRCEQEGCTRNFQAKLVLRVDGSLFFHPKSKDHTAQGNWAYGKDSSTGVFVCRCPEHVNRVLTGKG